MTATASEIESSRATVLWWEKMRLVYNGILLVPGIMLAWWHVRVGMHPPGPTSLPDTVAGCVAFGFLANVCYCLGPYVEFVVISRGFPRTAPRLRWFLWGLGLLLSLALISGTWITLAIFGNWGGSTMP